jgi:hypothetical protein
MLLTEFFLNGIRTKEKSTVLTEKQKRRLFEFDLSAGFEGDFNAWRGSLSHKVDKKAEERYSQAVAAGTRLSFKEYRETVLNKKK